MNFWLFMLLNTILLVRPEELFPAIAGARLYLITIGLCTMVNFSRLVELLSLESLKHRPIAVCILLFFAATLISLFVLGRVDEALFEFGPEFAKVILYYFLLLASVDTEERFRSFVGVLILLIGILTAVALAQHYGYMEFQNIIPCLERIVDPASGEEQWIGRLVSSGIFNDPNDLCLILGFGILSCIYRSSTSALGGLERLFWLLPIPLFIYALLETHSRGGLLGVMAGCGAYVFSRYGGPRAVPFVAVGGVGVLALIGGRQGNISGGGTAHERLMMWAGGLTELLNKPLYIPTGLGNGWFDSEYTLVAHNSFVQAYVEDGLIGGGAFMGAFVIGIFMLFRLGSTIPAPPWVVQARHYGFAALAGYGMGCYSVTRNFVIPTYLTLGIASILLGMAAPTLPERFQVSQKWLIRGILLAVCGLIFMKVATQILGKAGV